MWKKLTCHSNATRRSKSRIFQELCLAYKPLSPEFLAQQRQKYAEEKEYWDKRRSGLSEEHLKRWRDAKNSKFECVGWGMYVHKKNIPFELWDEAEIQEYERLMDGDTPYKRFMNDNQ